MFLGLHLLGDLDNAPALELIDREVQAWMEHFREMGRKRAMWPPQKDLDTEMHQVSLLRGLLESAGAERDALQHRFDKDWLANDSFAAFGGLLGINLDLVEPVSFGSFDTEKMREALLRSRISEDKQLDMLLTEQLLRYIPIGFPDAECEGLPVDLVYNIGYGRMNEVRVLM